MVQFRKLTVNDKYETLKLLKERLKTMVADKDTKATEIKTTIDIIDTKEKALFLPKEAY